jgi:hypothetical protein
MFGVNTGTPYLLVFMSDGSAYAFNAINSAVVSIASAGTFANTGADDVAVWNGVTALIIDSEKGYFRWPGAGGGTASPSVSIIPAPTVNVGAAGSVEAGSHQYALTYVINAVETKLGQKSSTLTLSVASHVTLTNIPVGPTGTTARKIYRTAANQVSPFKLLTTISDNTTTTYDDNIADGSLGANSPASGAVDAGSHAWAYSFITAAVESALSDPSVMLNLSTPSTVLVYDILAGPGGTTDRKIYRTPVADPSTYKLVTTITNNSTTEYSDITDDASLGAAFAGTTSNTVTQIDATKVGTTLAVFSGRVWIANGRTVQYTAPNSFTDFDPADAAGSFIMTDSNFVGNMQKLLAGLDVLWIFGEAAINQLGNVNIIANTTTTTFSNINVSSSVGTIFPQSVISYLRQIEFASKYGIIQQVGVTPQRISEKIDGTYRLLDLSQPVTAGLVILNNILCYGLMVTYLDPDNDGTARKIILLVTFDGKWFIGSQGDGLIRMASVEYNGSYRLFGADDHNIRELFVQPHYPVHRLKTPFFDNGDVTAGKEMVRAMMVMHFPEETLINSTITAQVTGGPKNALDPTKNNELELFDAQGADIQLLGSGNNQLQFIAKGYALQQWLIGANSQLIGFDMSFDSDPFDICAYALDVIQRQSWGDTS